MKLLRLIPILAAMLSLVACRGIDDERIPRLPVSIKLDDNGLWNSFGVAGVGIYREFILGKSPAGFHYNAGSATGFGGVLLIGGMDPFTNDPNVPLAYDLACPYCRTADIRIHVNDAMEGECDVCGSRYDLIMGGGTPIYGAALSHKFGLRRYTCLPGQYGGYYITD